MEPPDLEPVAWTPQKAPPLTGAFEPNSVLASVSRIRIQGTGPEDVVVDHNGRVVYGVADGRLVSSDQDGSRQEVVVDTEGRPMGIEIHPDGTLVVCDAYRGLLAIRNNRVQVLADRFEGVPLRFANNAAVAEDGSIYFTESSRRFGLHQYRNDLFEHSNTGRLFRRHPDGDLEVLLDGLSFANGVALSSDQTTVYVAETGEYRINRYHLTGLHAGRREVFSDNLPGIPDNLTATGGTIWAAMFTPRNKLLDLLLPHPRLRGAVQKLPESLQPQPVRYSFVLGFDEQTGVVTHNLQDPSGGYAPITSARQHEDRLWLGSLTEPALAAIYL
jgi:sugar lactone lactonase YvrE